jgi:KAP family P-loop domain
MYRLFRKAKAWLFDPDTTQPALSSPEDKSGELTPGAQFASDLPIETAAQDRFERAGFAIGIARKLAERRDSSSLVVAINGPWGDGKTSVLRMMETELANHPTVAVAKFNPWRFGSDEDLLRAFFETLATAMEQSLMTGVESAGKALRDYGCLLSPVGGADAAKGLGQKLSETSLETLRKRVEAFLNTNCLRIIMMIDDIDRLDKREIQSIFKLVKLSAGFNNISYVLAFDDEVVASALGERYGNGDANAGRRFLEKIVQIPLTLPPADPIELRRLAFDGANVAVQESGLELTEEQAGAFVRHYVDGLEPGVTSPRQVRLYGNALLFALPLLKGEVHPVDQMLIEGIRVVYPQLYAYIRDHAEDLLTSERGTFRRSDEKKREIYEAIDACLPRLDKDRREQVRARLLEKLFPRLGSMGYGTEWESIWFKEQRVCSLQYFPRYFTYSVLQRDISDVAVARFLAAADDGNEAYLEEVWASVAARNATEQFVRKLRQREESVASAPAALIARLVARHGDAVPRGTFAFYSDWGFMQAAILVAHLLRRVESEQRLTIARQMIATSAFDFAFECLQWFKTDSTRPEAEANRLFSTENEEILGKLFAQRIGEEATKQPIFRRFGRDTGRFLWIWNQHEAPKPTEHLTAALNADPEAAVDLLSAYVGTATGVETGLTFRADFERKAYDTVTDLVSADLILHKLQERFGVLLDDSTHYFARETPFGNRVANQFAYIHKHVAAEGTAAATATPRPNGAA